MLTGVEEVQYNNKEESVLYYKKKKYKNYETPFQVILDHYTHFYN